MKVSLKYGNLEVCNQTHGDGNTEKMNAFNVFFQLMIDILTFSELGNYSQYTKDYSCTSIIYEMKKIWL